MYSEEDIISYYNKSEIQYKITWKLDKALALHYGYNDETTKNFPDSLLNMNRKLIELAHIKSSDLVLDAGCGVGGSTVFMAKQIGCHVTGITLPEKQVISARRHAKRLGVSDLCRFEQQNYLNTTFKDESFDVIWGLESVCHALDKADFYEEAFRLLKPGGRLIVSDYVRKHILTSDENTILTKWLSGWAIDNISSVEEIEDYMRPFSSYEIHDRTKNIWPSAKRMWLWHYIGYPYHRFYNNRFTNSYETEANFQAAKYQYIALKKKIWSYKITVAVK